MLESVLLRCLAMPDKDTDSRQASKPTFAIFRKTPGINGVGDRLKRLYR